MKNINTKYLENKKIAKMFHKMSVSILTMKNRQYDLIKNLVTKGGK